MINSLTTRIFAIFWLSFALILILILFAFKLDSCQLIQLLDNDQQQSVVLQQYVKTKLSSDTISDLIWWRRLFHKINNWSPFNQHLILVNKKGRIISAKHNEIQIIRNFIEQSANTSNIQKKKYGCIELIGPFNFLDGDNSYQLYQICQSNSAQSNFISLLFDFFPLLLIIAIIVSTPLLLLLARNLVKSANKLKCAADEVAHGNLQQYPELESGLQEFLAIGISFNQMISTLEQMIIAQQRLLLDLFHELRTPLTRLQLAIALIRRKYGEGNELIRIETEAQRLNSMINDLLDLSHNQYKNELSQKVIEANNLWSDVLNNAMFEAEQMGKSLEVISPPGKWRLLGNPSILDSALENIVRNALRYSHQHIIIRFIKNQQGITITVDDDGPGVSKEDHEQIFRPFYRIRKECNHNSDGTGLGLAIVKIAIIQHRGWVKAEDSPLGGLRLIIWLPLLSYD